MTTKTRIGRLEAALATAGHGDLRGGAEKVAARFRAEGMPITAEDVLAEAEGILRAAEGCATPEAAAAAVAAHLTRGGTPTAAADVLAEMVTFQGGAA